MWPAMFAYHVCEWTMSASLRSEAMARSMPSVLMEAFAPFSSGR